MVTVLLSDPCWGDAKASLWIWCAPRCCTTCECWWLEGVVHDASKYLDESEGWRCV